MSEKKEKTSNSKPKYKAVDPVQFREWHNDTVPCYEKLCAGEAVELNVKDKSVINWLNNNIIVKEK